MGTQLNEEGTLPAEDQEQAEPAIETISRGALRHLLDISTRLSSTLHLDELLSMVMDVATELTNTQRASILLVDRTTGNLHFAASTDGQVPENIIVPLDKSIAGWVVRKGRSLILDDVQADERFYASVDQELRLVTRSMLAVPLITRRGVIGALEVLNKRDDALYTSEDVALMEALASQSAVAIMNASLFHQSDLLAEIMHELKTPMMAITAASDLLSRPDLPQERHGQLVGMIKRESMRLGQMTRDFLEFARLESGRERIKRDPVELADIISDVIHIAQSQAEARRIAIRTDLPGRLPAAGDNPALIGDSDRIKQVLLNLVSNAIKYNVESGSVTIRAAVEESGVSISVTDTGSGIAEEDIGHLFERFYRIPGSEEKSEGSGMGLAIAKKLVEEHKGRIEVASKLGEGTSFTVHLPLSPVVA